MVGRVWRFWVGCVGFDLFVCLFDGWMGLGLGVGLVTFVC